MANLLELRNERIRKLNQLKSLGINCYPSEVKRDISIGDLINDFDNRLNQELNVAGRISAIRKFGKIAFIKITDQSGSIQLFLQEDVVSPLNKTENSIGYAELPLLDTGDFLQASGVVSLSKTGEKSIEVKKLTILDKTLRPLPSKIDGFTSKEERFRRRYVDLNVNIEIRDRYIRRSMFWNSVREYLNVKGFIEINTPVLEHTTGGADAQPFITHMNALDEDFYLRISHELPLKKLLGGGFEKVYDIGPRFRNENYSDEHLPEHVAMESYMAYQNYDEAIQFYEDFLKTVAFKTWGKLQFKVSGFEVDLDKAWPVVKYSDIMKEKFGVDVLNPDLNQLKEILLKNKIKLDGEINTLRALDNVWKLIRASSAGPFWLVGEPIMLSPLAKSDPRDDRISLRFHPVIAGSEMGNGYAELNDPIDQLDRFKAQQKLRDLGDDEAQMMDIDFVEMLEYGMPPACGWGISERFFWALEGVTAREGVPFPQLRREVDNVTKDIYPEIFKNK